MYFLKPPADEVVDKLLEGQRAQPFSYANPGMTWDAFGDFEPSAIKKYKMDRYQTLLGKGEAVFRKAKEAFERWEMFSLPWIRLYPVRPSMQEGTAVGVLAKACGVWILNFCRVVRVSSQARSIGFSYGTLPLHLEEGEEKFSVNWSPEDDAVFYEITAFSRPHLMISRLAYPYTRLKQKQFCRESMEAIQKRACKG